ncbi:PREDICTED: xyloside xylosyltransferase 1-like [Priapulus caudatus]|uniref:Xyloside xylosyltransferase 1-like n=1 Tax=Priapulus caudatus TaxID=37621 RepID=A0ABM1E1X8_PRICU|nr:PREDICTED: xyloside xylosyltransferase 1-like [Priapulus caudatus]
MEFRNGCMRFRRVTRWAAKLWAIALAVLVLWYGLSSLRADRGLGASYESDDPVVATYLREQAAFASQSDAAHSAADAPRPRAPVAPSPASAAANDSRYIDVLILFTKAKGNAKLAARFRTCVASMLRHASVPIHYHLVSDDESAAVAADAFRELAEPGRIAATTPPYRVRAHSVSEMARQLHGLVSHLQAHFSYKPGAYYSDALFFLSVALHRVLDLRRVIMLDSDLEFRGDIGALYDHFARFKDGHVMGMAHEMQPVYRHTFSAYRGRHPGTRVGGPPPGGLTGYNSGVVLLDLDRMRRSREYNDLLNASVISDLAAKYSFKGHLGDQDFFTLISLEHEDLFYTLPCTWNYQLCTWWRDHGYTDIFEQYFTCEGDVMVYHGNCGSQIPS